MRCDLASSYHRVAGMPAWLNCGTLLAEICDLMGGSARLPPMRSLPRLEDGCMG